MSKSTAESIRPLTTGHSTGRHGESEHNEAQHGAEARAEQVRAAEELARLEAAFPWSGTLPLAERARFARELADHPKRASDRDLDRLLALWRARAKAYEHGHGRGLRAA